MINIKINDIEMQVIASMGAPKKNWGKIRYKHIVIVRRKEYPPQKFDFWSSVVDFAAGKNTLDDAGLKDALECFVSDAISGDMDIAEFRSEFGYEKVPESTKAHKMCVKTKAQFEALGIDIDELYELGNMLQGELI